LPYLASPLSHQSRKIVMIHTPLLVLGFLAHALAPSGIPAGSHSLSPVADPGDRTTIAIHFDARIGDLPFTCGTRYDGVGAASSTIEPRDLRLYVSRFEAVLDDGSSVPMELEQDGLWQHGSVALLDFEDGTAGCRNGNDHLRSEVVGSLPTEAASRLSGVKFEVGVPFSLNHMNQAAAPSPLSLTALFWSWNAGYKFIRAEVMSDGLPQGFFIHLGSTGCSPEGRASRPATQCANGNRVQVELPRFDPSSQQIVFDLAALLEGVDLSGEGVEGDRSACMSSPDDARCAPIFDALGLPFDGVTPGAQRVFIVENLRPAAFQ